MCEFFVCSDACFRRRDAYVGFIYAGTLWFGRSRMFEVVSLVLWRMPEHSIVDGREL